MGAKKQGVLLSYKWDRGEKAGCSIGPSEKAGCSMTRTWLLLAKPLIGRAVISVDPFSSLLSPSFKALFVPVLL